RPDEQDAARRVVDDEAGVPAQALGAEPLVVAVAGADEQVGAVAGGDHLALDPSVADLRHGVAAEALARVREQRLGGLVGDLLPARSARRRRAAAEQAGTAPGMDLLELGRRHREQEDLGVLGDEQRGRVDARLPSRLGCPDDDPHHTTCRANHSTAVDAIRIGGTVRAPSFTNSPRSVSWSWEWS